MPFRSADRGTKLHQNNHLSTRVAQLTTAWSMPSITSTHLQPRHHLILLPLARTRSVRSCVLQRSLKEDPARLMVKAKQTRADLGRSALLLVKLLSQPNNQLELWRPGPGLPGPGQLHTGPSAASAGHQGLWLSHGARM